MLTDRAIRVAKPGSECRRLSDGRGLCLRIYPTGRKAWELRYRASNGQQRTVDLGDYGDGMGQRGLADARSEAQRLRDLLRAGHDPRAANAQAKQGGALLSEVADSWYRHAIAAEYRRPENVRALLDRHILPRLGARPIAELKRGDLFLVVAGILDGSANGERRAPRVAGQVL